MTNKYLEKIAKRADPRSLKAAPIHSKIGLGLGMTSLGLSLANFHNNTQKNEIAEQQKAVEERSLQALRKIHTAIEKLPAPVVVVDPVAK